MRSGVDGPTNSAESLERADVVLIRPKYAGNLGSVARVMLNMGFARLSLVRPRTPIDAEARWMAAGADAILDDARTFPSMDEAVSGADLVIGTTSRGGARQFHNICPAEAATMLRGTWASGRLALIFGPEDRGLSGEELDRCNWVTTIPTYGPKASINLSHAVLLLCYEIRKAMDEAEPRRVCRAVDIERLCEHLERTLFSIGFLKRNDPRRMMLKLRRTLMRTELDARERKSVYAILRHIDGLAEPPDEEDE
ncbi:RNA methyltransferase [Thermodesulfobacteriota bacterium]